MPAFPRFIVALALLAMLPALASPPAHRTPLPDTPQFRRIGLDQGLPSSRINALAQDRTGYVWIATDDGVARYDGLGMRVWRHNPGIVGGMADNLVNTLHVDARDDVWLGFATGGLGIIDGRRREVRPLADSEAGVLASADVWAMAETADGSLWFGTFDEGLFRRDGEGRYSHLGAVPVGGSDEPRKDIVTLAATPDGVLWIGTAGGLAHHVAGRLEAVSAPEFDGQAILHLNAEPDGSLWVATRTALWRRSPEGRVEASPWVDELGGIRVHGVQRDGRGGRWIHTARGLFHDDGSGLQRFLNPEASEGSYQQMLVDRQGGLWFGDSEFGLVWLSGYWRSFASLTRQGDPRLQLSMRQAVAFAQDAEGRVLVGGEDGHLDRIDPVSGTVERNVVDPAVFEGTRLFALVPHSDGSLWVGTSRLLLRRDPAGQWRRWSTSSADALPPGSIDAIVAMPDGDLWIAAYGGGLQRRAADGRLELSVTPESGHGLATIDVEAMLRGPDGALWVANSQGVLRWDGERFEPVVDAAGGPVLGLAFVDADDLWIYRTGLLQRWQQVDGRWRNTDHADSGNDGLPAAEAGGLVHDAAGRLWIFSIRGLVRFDPASRGVRRFGPGDGLALSEFGLRSPAVLDGGVVIAGAVGGAVLFDPVSVEPDGRVAPMVVESISVRRAEDLVELDPTGPLVLAPGDRDLRVVVRLMSFADPAAHRFRFRLNGYDPDWVDVGASGERLLPRQAPGTYQLDIVASGADGRWSEPQTLAFTVRPPWWRSGWAWSAYALSLLGLFAGLYVLLRYRFRRKAERQRVLEARQAAQRASEAKSAFLADLGHELRTPLTGVLGMTELLLKEPLTPGQRQRAETVFRAGQHLLRLVNDTLDLARIEAGRLLLQDAAFDLPGTIADVAQMLRPVAEAKGLVFDVQLAPGLPPRVRGDEARLRQVLLNLGGNAIKFTEQGSVAFVVSPLADGGVELVVQDTGIGLDEAQQQRLFQRFEQAEGEHTQRRFGGTGLGLAISRELVRTMGGELQLESAKGQGSRFTVRLPLVAASDDAEDVESGRRSVALAPVRAFDILLVEDDPVVAEVMRGLLESQGHRVHHAPQALAALTLLKTRRVDVGFLDLDLPAVDGIELAGLIRRNGWALPLLAVTARADAASERAALAAGMDGYLRKPVSGAMLAEALAGITPADASSSAASPPM